MEEKKQYQKRSFVTGKVSLVLLFVFLALTLIACSDSSEKNDNATGTKANATNKPAEKEDDDGVLTKPGQTSKEEDYTVELLKFAEVNKDIDMGPLKVHLKDAKILKYKNMTEDFKKSMQPHTSSNIGSEINYIQLSYTTENTEERNLEWNGIKSLVTDQKEQIDGFGLADFIVDDIDTDPIYYGKVIKEGLAGYILQKESVNKVKIIFASVDTPDLSEELSPTKEFEFEF